MTKLNSTGTGLIYSTYLGGSETDNGVSIAIDSERNAYITGKTRSINFPVTPEAYQTSHSGIEDNAFVTKLNSTGTGLIYSTYLGGNISDEGKSITLDSEGNAYLTGDTGSTDFPVTEGAFQTTYSGYSDVFVTKLNSTGSGLIYSTYLGGDNQDNGFSIVLDSEGIAYLMGYTESTNFPVTPGAYQITKHGYNDAFVAKLHLTPAVYIKDEKEVTPKAYILEQNYPNPFNPSTVIRFSLPAESSVTLYVYNSIGESVRQLNLGIKHAGVSEFTFNAAGLSSGVYFYSIKASSSDGNITREPFMKMIILK